MLVSPCSEYYSVKKLNNLLKKSGSNLFIFHCNTRSLWKNFNLLEEILDFMDSQPDIFGITETKLNESSGVLHNLIIPTSRIQSYNTRENLYRPVSKTNYGLSRFTPTASRIWENVPCNIKTLPFPSFIKQYKRYLLDSQI